MFNLDWETEQQIIYYYNYYCKLKTNKNNKRVILLVFDMLKIINIDYYNK